ncbi:hypothetical protein PI124_g6672 [Phytophthora idaei]|nr:hypothetical protein PI126_g6066 [Phytophthora idaei]KAG3248646.1 hypothetical protein PI124_g6672 [Phytophthora idaei]
MDVNAAFVDVIYNKVKASPTYQEHFRGKKIVVVLDNVPAHSQTESRVVEHDDLVLLRLAPYSPMCNPLLQRPQGKDPGGSRFVARGARGAPPAWPDCGGPYGNLGARCQAQHQLYGPPPGEQDRTSLSARCGGR